jgi:hypothetical protein
MRDQRGITPWSILVISVLRSRRPAPGGEGEGYREMPLHNHSAPSKSGLGQHDRRFRILSSPMYLLLISLVWMLEERVRK